MPISARTKKTKTNTLGQSIEVDKSNQHLTTFDSVQDNSANTLQQTAQFGSQQLGGTETPRKRQVRINDIPSQIGETKAYTVVSRREKTTESSVYNDSNKQIIKSDIHTSEPVFKEKLAFEKNSNTRRSQQMSKEDV